ncbi:MAG TPA: PAS domain S-box protein, partial [Thermoanaerobaculia bacterium]
MLVTAFATLILIGWAAEVAVLRRGMIGSVEVRPAAAVALLLVSVALLLPRRASRVPALVAAAIGLITLIEYAFGVDFGVDHLGFADGRAEAGRALFMRMSPQSAAGALLSGLALLAFHRGSALLRRVGLLAAMLTSWIALQALFGVAYGGHLFLARPLVTPMSPVTALLFLIWSVGFFALTTAEGPAALFVRRDRWGHAVRRITVVTIAAPFLFGLLCLRLVDARVIDARFAITAAITATTLTLLFTIVTYTDRVREEDSRRGAAEEASRRTQELYRMIVETSLEGICIADADGRLTFVNSRLAEMLGEPRETLIGSNLFDYITDVQSTATYEDAPLGAQQELRMQSADGRVLDVLCSSTGFRRENGTFDGVVAMLVDTTERVAARRALERAHELLLQRVEALEGGHHEDLQRAHDSIDQYRARIEELASRLTTSHLELETFSYSVSHDLRAPLRTIDGFSRELLRSHSLDDRGKLYVQRIQAGAQRMSALIDALLDLSRVSHAAVHREPVDVTALATSVASDLRERSNAPVTIEVLPGLRAEADPRLLRIGFENLIGNAIKFSARREEPRICVGSTGDGALFVRDNGIGFDPQHAERVFTPF